MPVEPEGAREPQSGEAFAGGGEAEVEGGTEVVLVGAEPGDGLALSRTEPGAFMGGGARLRPVALAAPGGGLLAGQPAQPLQAVVAQGEQEPVAHPVRTRLPAQHRLVDKSGDGFEDVVRADLLAVRAHGLRRVQVEAAGQYGGAGPHQLLALRAQFVAPVDGGAQGLVPGQGGRAAGVEQAVAVVEAVEELLDAEDAHPDGSEFDGEREAVEAAAQPGDGGPVGGGETEAGDDGGGAVGEEGQGGVAVGGGEVTVRVGDRQRTYVQEVFLGEAQAVAAGGEDTDAGGAVQQGGGEFGAGGQQMLAVVEDEQQPPVPYLLHEGVQRGLRGVVVQAERVGGGERDERRVVQACQVHEAHAVREGAGHPGREARGEPGLADAAGSGERDQPSAGQQLAAFGQFVPAVDETGRLGRQVTVPSWR